MKENTSTVLKQIFECLNEKDMRTLKKHSKLKSWVHTSFKKIVIC